MDVHVSTGTLFGRARVDFFKIMTVTAVPGFHVESCEGGK
jgi:hypothetical protein